MLRRGPSPWFIYWDGNAVHMLGQLHTFKLIWTVCTVHWGVHWWGPLGWNCCFCKPPGWKHSQAGSTAKSEAKSQDGSTAAPHAEPDTKCWRGHVDIGLGSTLAQWWNDGQIERLPENFVISQFHIFIHTITIFPISFARSYQGLSSRTKKIFDRANIMYLDW